MGVGTGFIVAGVVAAGLAVGHALIDNDPAKSPSPPTEQTQPAKAPEPAASQPDQAQPAPVQPAQAEPAKTEPAPAAGGAAKPEPTANQPAAAEPAKPEPVAQPQSACAPDVNLKGGFVVDKHVNAEGNCVKTGKIHPLMAIECTDGSPAGWFHRYYLDDKRSPVFVTACMPPGNGK